MIVAKIDKYSHHFVVTRIHPSFKWVISKALEDLIQTQWIKIRGKARKQATKVFAASNAERDEFRFHINYWNRFKSIYQYNFSDDVLDITEHALYEPAEPSGNMEMSEELKLRDYQQEAIEYCLEDGYSKLVTIYTGGGKGVCRSTKVRIPNGWKPIGELQIGDEVMSKDRSFTKVKGIYDHQSKPCYKIVFDDERSIVCDEDHLWKIHIKDQSMTNDFIEQVIDTKTLYQNFNDTTYYAIPLIDRIGSDNGGYGSMRFRTEEQAIAFRDEVWSKGYVAKLYSGIFFRGTAYSVDYYSNDFGLLIKSIEPVPSVPTRCIEVEHPSKLFIIENYIVTHNTFTALKLGELLNTRLIIVVLARYVEKWVEDVIGAYGKECNLKVVKGGSDFIKLLQYVETTGDAPDVTIISSTTMQRYISTWESMNHFERQDFIDPCKIWDILKVGYRIVDEAHQHFHFIFKMDLYTHLPKTLSLTATLESNDSFMLSMYDLMWPPFTRNTRLTPPAYDETYALFYHHNKPDKIRYISSQGYSHIMYEQSLFKHVPSRRQYLDMIGDQVEQHFLPIYEKGKKMLIFCSMIDTCIIVSEYLNKRFKDQQWQISKFTSGDPKEVIDTNDITVSTLGKSGTALDVAGLVICLMTVALAEPKANIQAKGRLRDLSKKPGFEHITPKFLYFVGSDIDKHRHYHKQKKDLFSNRTKLIKEVSLPYTIGIPMGEYTRQMNVEDNGF